MSVQGKEKFQSTAMKISVNDTQVVTKNVWISQIIIHEDTPQKINASYATLSATLWGFPKSTVSSDCQQNSLGTGDTPVQTFYSERESRAFLNKIPINRLTLRASYTYTSCLRLHHNIFPSPLPDNQTLFSH